MIAREEYLKKLRLFKNKQLIKVVTGIRRCGKSTLLKAFAEELNGGEFSKNPDPRCNIIFINFEDLQNEHLLNYRAAYDYIYSKLAPDKMNYIFLDEIQQVENFQKAVDSLFILDNTDIYITGSNSKLLSGELATLLTGRYAEIKMLPLSFKEFSPLAVRTCRRLLRNISPTAACRIPSLCRAAKQRISTCKAFIPR